MVALEYGMDSISGDDHLDFGVDPSLGMEGGMGTGRIDPLEHLVELCSLVVGGGVALEVVTFLVALEVGA